MDFGSFAGRPDYDPLRRDWNIFPKLSTHPIRHLLQSPAFPIKLWFAEEKAIPLPSKPPDPWLEGLYNAEASEEDKRITEIPPFLKIVPFGESLLVAHSLDPYRLTFSRLLPWWSADGQLPKLQHIPSDHCQWPSQLPWKSCTVSSGGIVTAATDFSFGIFIADPGQGDDVLLGPQWRNTIDSVDPSAILDCATAAQSQRTAVLLDSGAVYSIDWSRLALMQKISTFNRQHELHSLRFRSDERVLYGASKRGLYSLDMRSPVSEEPRNCIVHAPTIPIQSILPDPSNPQYVVCAYGDGSVGLLDHRNYKQACLEWRGGLFTRKKRPVGTRLEKIIEHSDGKWIIARTEGKPEHFSAHAIPWTVTGGPVCEAPHLPLRLGSEASDGYRDPLALDVTSLDMLDQHGFFPYGRFGVKGFLGLSLNHIYPGSFLPSPHPSGYYQYTLFPSPDDQPPPDHQQWTMPWMFGTDALADQAIHSPTHLIGRYDGTPCPYPTRDLSWILEGITLGGPNSEEDDVAKQMEKVSDPEDDEKGKEKLDSEHYEEVSENENVSISDQLARAVERYSTSASRILQRRWNEES